MVAVACVLLVCHLLRPSLQERQDTCENILDELNDDMSANMQARISSWMFMDICFGVCSRGSVGLGTNVFMDIFFGVCSRGLYNTHTGLVCVRALGRVFPGMVNSAGLSSLSFK